jgi:hypothetical protein
MKRGVVLLAVFLMLWAVILPGSAWAREGWHGGRHGGHGGWWWPGAIIGGLTLGVAAAVTAPIWMLSAATAYSPPVAYAPPAVYAAPPAYSSLSTTYAQAPNYAPAPNYARAQASAVQREVVYPNGRYLLYGDGVQQPWQWVWVPSASPPPPPPLPQQ